MPGIENRLARNIWRPGDTPRGVKIFEIAHPRKRGCKTPRETVKQRARHRPAIAVHRPDAVRRESQERPSALRLLLGRPASPSASLRRAPLTCALRPAFS